MRTLLADALLVAGVLCALLACIGVLVVRDSYDRLHYAGPTVLAALLVAAAVWVREGPSLIADKATLTAAFVLACGPLLAHATAQSARSGERGDWRAGIGEEIEVEEP